MDTASVIVRTFLLLVVAIGVPHLIVVLSRSQREESPRPPTPPPPLPPPRPPKGCQNDTALVASGEDAERCDKSDDTSSSLIPTATGSSGTTPPATREEETSLSSSLVEFVVAEEVASETKNDGAAANDNYDIIKGDSVDVVPRGPRPEPDSLMVSDSPQTSPPPATLTVDLCDKEISTVDQLLHHLRSPGPEMPTIHELLVARNQLTTLTTDFMFTLGNIQQLDLTDNQLVHLPPELAQLAHLQSLHVACNQLIALPDELGQLTRLRSLDCRNNCLTELPSALGQLCKLEHLDVSGNRLKSLPNTLGQLDHCLLTLNAIDNPWDQPWKEILPYAITAPVVKKRNSRAELPPKIVKKGRRYSSDTSPKRSTEDVLMESMDSIQEDGTSPTLARPISSLSLSSEIPSQTTEESRTTGESQTTGEDPAAECLDQSSIDSPPMMDPASAPMPLVRRMTSAPDAAAVLSSTSPTNGRFSTLFRTGSSTSAARSRSPTKALSPPSRRVSDPMFPPPVAAPCSSGPSCGLQFVLQYLRDLYDLDPERREIVRPSRASLMIPELTATTTTATEKLDPTRSKESDGCEEVKRKRAQRRERIIAEILSTEEAYITFLETVVKVCCGSVLFKRNSLLSSCPSSPTISPTTSTLTALRGAT